ncbi:MAG: hypothetical protein ACR2NB_12055 [Solirubrobacteraceae bacterium]
MSTSQTQPTTTAHCVIGDARGIEWYFGTAEQAKAHALADQIECALLTCGDSYSDATYVGERAVSAADEVDDTMPTVDARGSARMQRVSAFLGEDPLPSWVRVDERTAAWLRDMEEG